MLRRHQKNVVDNMRIRVQVTITSPSLITDPHLDRQKSGPTETRQENAAKTIAAVVILFLSTVTLTPPDGQILHHIPTDRVSV